MDELKPCPFCGGCCVSVEVDQYYFNGTVICRNCGVKVTGSTKEKAIEMWNGRAE